MTSVKSMLLSSFAISAREALYAKLRMVSPLEAPKSDGQTVNKREERDQVDDMYMCKSCAHNSQLNFSWVLITQGT